MQDAIIFESTAFPFFLGVSDTPSIPDGLPRRMPFALAVDKHRLVYQTTYSEVQECLKVAYRTGSILSTPPGPEGYSRLRADELLHGLRAVMRSFRGSRILEVGCATGYVLSRLEQEGAVVVGCEPGPSALIAQHNYGVSVVRSEFERGLFEPESFDLVFSSMVLEHVSDASRFLGDLMSLLRPGGVLFAAVPACDEQLKNGDPSLPCHEHHYYFTRDSLAALLQDAGGTNAHVRTTSHTLALHGWCRRRANREAGPAQPVRQHATGVGDHFGDRFNRKLQSLQNRLRLNRGGRIAMAGISIGASVLSGLLDWSEVECGLFDIDSQKHGKYIPGVDHPIQPDEAILKWKPDEIWVLPTLNARRIGDNIATRSNMPRERVFAVSEM